MVWLDRMTWKEHNWKVGDRGVWKTGVWIDLSEWVKTKIFVSHVKVR